MVNLNEAITSIRRVGVTNVRVLPMAGENALEGKFQIEIKDTGDWQTIVSGVSKSIAEGIVSQATNRVILG
jgi:hypothetical protein